MYLKYNNDLVSFQNGVDTIVDGCTTYGSTPSESTPSAIVESIETIYTDRYNAGGTATKKGNATAANVLSGKTFTFIVSISSFLSIIVTKELYLNKYDILSNIKENASLAIVYNRTMVEKAILVDEYKKLLGIAE